MITEKQGLKNLAKNLREIMEDEGMTQAALAKALITRTSKRATLESRISRAINGANMPSPVFLANVCEVLEIKIEELLQD